MLSTFCFCEVQNFTTHPIFLPNKTLISHICAASLLISLSLVLPSLSVWRDQIESILPKPNPNLSTSAQYAACLFSSHALSFFHLSLSGDQQRLIDFRKIDLRRLLLLKLAVLL